MLKTQSMLIEQLNSYANPKTKLARLVKAKQYYPIVKGLYETKADTPGYLLAGSIYGPSYLSFEFALSLNGLIPERVTTFTSATCLKKKKKLYKTDFGIFTYRDIPLTAFPYGITLKEEGNYFYRIATAEKALCDKLYSAPALSNQNQLQAFLYADLRIDEYNFKQLNFEDFSQFSNLYGSNNVRLLSQYTRRLLK